MVYDFSNLSHADFEDLVRDLVGSELNVRFEAFGAGPDGGMDGRHSNGGQSMILQAKHYARSQFRTLLGAIKRERPAIDRLAPARYLLATSQSLTPPNKKKLATAIGPTLKNQDDIFSAGDLNALLRKYPTIEKTHIKLWLSSTSVLERVIRSASYVIATITMDEIAAKVHVYAPNRSFGDARATLEAQHILIISGPPGVGKTTLAEMLAYTYVADGWKLVPIRSLDDGFAAIVDAEKQIFFFDDFLGRIALDKYGLAAKDSDLVRFMNRIRHSPNARFVLTTRAYIFEEARRISEHLADDRLDISKYVLDVGVYTRRIKARILYNHLLVAGTPTPHVQALIESGKVPKIVDHVNYNPRVIEWMTDKQRVVAIPANQYADAFINALANPKKLWDTAFRTHIPEKCRHLLYSLFFSSEYGEGIDELRISYQAVHSQLCTSYGHPHDPKDFEESLRILEGGFVQIHGRTVTFINPSIRDYLTDYLDDFGQLKNFALAARQARWAEAVWQQGKKFISGSGIVEFAASFLGVASDFHRLPMWKRSASNPSAYSIADLWNTDRIRMLLDWWKASGNEAFARLAAELAIKPVGGFISWRDGADLIELIANFTTSYPEFPFEEEMLLALTDGAINMLNGGVASDDLERISDMVDLNAGELAPELVDAVQEAIRRVFDEIGRAVGEMDSESTLDEQKEVLIKLAPRAGIGDENLAAALHNIDDRILAITAETEEAEAPSFTGPIKNDTDKFDDIALMNLFAPLLERKLK